MQSDHVDRLTTIILIGISLVGTAGSSSGQQDALLQLYREAQQSQSAGDYQKAIANYKRIVALRPEMAEAYSNLGILYYDQHQADHALTAFKKAIELKPELAAPYFFLGVLRFTAHAYDDALKYLSKAEVLDPSNTLIHSYLGYTHYANSSFSQAVQQFEKATEIDGANPDLFYYLSRSYGHLAEKFFAELQKTFAHSFYTHLARAHFYEAQEKWDSVRVEYESALAQQPANKRLQQKATWAAHQKPGQPRDPFESPDPDVTIDGSTRFLYAAPIREEIKAELVRYRALLAQQKDRRNLPAQGLYSVAEDYYALSYLASLWVYQTDPGSYRAHQLKGEYQETLGNDEAAIEEYKLTLQLKPDLQNVHFAIGNIYWKLSRLDDALAELQLELAMNPNHPRALYEMGDVLLATPGKLTDAEQYLLKCLTIDPTMLDAHLAIERIYSLEGQYTKSLRHLTRAAELDPRDPAAHYRMWRIYLKLGQSERAQTELQIYVKLKSQKGEH